MHEKLPNLYTTKGHNILSTPAYRSKHIYNIHKHINKNANVMKIKWKNNPYIGDI